MQRGVVSLVIFAVLLLLSLDPPADAQTKKIEMAYSAISASHATLYFTKEAGIFEKHGLSLNLNYVASGSRVAQALLAGEFPIAFAGSAVVFANLSGGDVVYVGADFVLRYALPFWGLEPGKDVKILQMGGQPEILAGMKSGAIQGAPVTSPNELLGRKAGFTVLTDLSKSGQYPMISIVSTRSSIKKDPDTVRAFLKAYAEGTHRFFKEKEGRKAEDFIDARIFEELERTGYFKSLQ